MIKYSWREFQSSESIGLIYRDVPSRKIDKKDPSWSFHSQTHMASTTICMNTKDALIGVSMPDLSADFPCLFPGGISPFRCPTSSSKLRAQNETHHHLPQPVSPLFDHLRASFLGESPMLRRALHLVFLKFFMFEQRVPYFHFSLGPKNYVTSFVSPSGVWPLPLLRKPKSRDLIPDPPFISFLYLIMLFHAQGFIPSKGSPYLKCLNAFFSSFKKFISTCPLITNQVHLYQKYLLIPESDTNAPSWSSTSPYLSLRLWFCPCATLSCLSSPKWLGAS